MLVLGFSICVLYACRFIDTSTGRAVDQHSGIESLTIGQKANIGGSQRKYYVVSKIVSEISTYLPLTPAPGEIYPYKYQLGDVYVGESDHPALYKSHIVTDGAVFNWLTCGVSAKLRLGLGVGLVPLDYLDHNLNAGPHSSCNPVDSITHAHTNKDVDVAENENPFMSATRDLILLLVQEARELLQSQPQGPLDSGLDSGLGSGLHGLQAVVDGCIDKYQCVPLVLPYESEGSIVDVHGMDRVRLVAEGYLGADVHIPPTPITSVTPVTPVAGKVGRGLTMSITGVGLYVSDPSTGTESAGRDESRTGVGTGTGVCASVDMRISGLNCLHRYRQESVPCSVRVRYEINLADGTETETETGTGLISLDTLQRSLNNLNNLTDLENVHNCYSLNEKDVNTITTAATTTTAITTGHRIEVWFEDENGLEMQERAPTPGQTVVLYHGSYCIGGGEIM